MYTSGQVNSQLLAAGDREFGLDLSAAHDQTPKSLSYRLLIHGRDSTRRARTYREVSCAHTSVHLRPFAPDDHLNERDSSPVARFGSLYSVKGKHENPE